MYNEQRAACLVLSLTKATVYIQSLPFKDMFCYNLLKFINQQQVH